MGEREETGKLYRAFLLKNGIDSVLSKADAKALEPLARNSYNELLGEWPNTTEEKKPKLIEKLDFTRNIIDLAEGRAAKVEKK